MKLLLHICSIYYKSCTAKLVQAVRPNPLTTEKQQRSGHFVAFLVKKGLIYDECSEGQFGTYLIENALSESGNLLRRGTAAQFFSGVTSTFRKRFLNNDVFNKRRRIQFFKKNAYMCTLYGGILGQIDFRTNRRSESSDFSKICSKFSSVESDDPHLEVLRLNSPDFYKNRKKTALLDDGPSP